MLKLADRRPIRAVRNLWREAHTSHVRRSALAATVAVLVGWLLLVPWGPRSQAQQSQSAGKPIQSATQTSQVSSNPSGAERPELTPDYQIGAQDVLEVNVFEAPELNRSLRVSASGKISMPLIGSVQAAGLTVAELENSLGEKYSKYIEEPQVGVLVSAVQSHPVSVLGAVKNPGTFQLQTPTTLLQILAKAGGLTPDAGGEVWIMRGGAVNESTSSPTEAHAVKTSRSEEHTSELQSPVHLVCRLLLEKKNIHPEDAERVATSGLRIALGEVDSAPDEIRILRADGSIGSAYGRAALLRHARVARLTMPS